MSPFQVKVFGYAFKTIRMDSIIIYMGMIPFIPRNQHSRNDVLRQQRSKHLLGVGLAGLEHETVPVPLKVSEMEDVHLTAGMRFPHHSAAVMEEATANENSPFIQSLVYLQHKLTVVGFTPV